MTRNVVFCLFFLCLLIWGCGPTEKSEPGSESAEKVVEQEKSVESIDMEKPVHTEQEMRDICISNQRVCEGAVAVYMKLNGGNLPEKLEDLVGEYLEEVPVCPKGGEYILDPETGSVTCSLAEHQRVEE